MTEVRPIDLGLLAGKHLQLQEGFAPLRTQAGHGAAQLHDATAVAAVPNHLEDARGAQPRMLIESLANKPNVRIDDGRTQRRCAVEALALDGMANGIGMNVQFTGNGANLPVFDVKVAANLCAGFRTDHDTTHFLGGVRGKGSTNRPTRPQIRQRSGKAGCPSVQQCDAGGFSCRSAGPHSNDAGDVIEREA